MNFLFIILASLAFVILAVFLLFAVNLWMWMNLEARADEAIARRDQMGEEVQDER